MGLDLVPDRCHVFRGRLLFCQILYTWILVADISTHFVSRSNGVQWV